MAKRFSDKVKAYVSKRAGYICEYCLAPSAFSSTHYAVEHIIPSSKGGSNTVSNLALACQGCNNIKFTKTEATDPESGKTVQLFNPRTHIWREHFCWDTRFIEIIGLTPVGRATIDALDLNRIEVCNLRAILFIIGEHPPDSYGLLDRRS